MSTLQQKSAKQALVAIMLGLLTLVMAACGSTAASSATTGQSQNSASDPSAVPQVGTALTGAATLQWDARTKNLAVIVTMTGLAPNSRHPEHIHTGSCASAGPILYGLTDLVADHEGNSASKTIIPHVTNGIAATGWYVNVHEGPGLTTPAQMVAIACGNVSNSHTSTKHDQAVFVKLNPQ